MTPLRDIIIEHEGRGLIKAEHYVPVYERFLEKFRGRAVNMLEIGVFRGGSLQVWKKYFGKDAHIFGLDIDPECKTYEEDRVKVFIGNQEDKKFMTRLALELPKLHIVLDDGGHTMAQQINTFEVLYPRLALGGVYICEDTGTSYWKDYGGGLKKPGTFIEYMKDRVDDIHAFHVDELEDLTIAKTTAGIHFYQHMVVLEKQRMQPVKDLTPKGKKRWWDT